MVDGDPGKFSEVEAGEFCLQKCDMVRVIWSIATQMARVYEMLQDTQARIQR